MKTIPIALPDEAFTKISDLARIHGTTIPEMAVFFIMSKLGMIGDGEMKKEIQKK